MPGEYAFVMKDLRKVVPPKREILRGIYLSFFHGAKIGVLGANGAGKSSLLRIMAGVDKDFLGEAFAADGLRIGYLPQEPQLDSTKDVRGNVEEGVAETRAILTRFEEVSAKLGEPLSDTEMEKLPGTSTARWKWRWTPCACRRATPTWRRSPAASAAALRCVVCC